MDPEERRLGVENARTALAMLRAEVDEDPKLTAFTLMAMLDDEWKTPEGLARVVQGLMMLNRWQNSWLAAAMTKADRLEHPPGQVVTREELLEKLGQTIAEMEADG